MTIILFLILGILIGAGCLFLFLKPRLQQTKQLDKTIQEKNEYLKQECEIMQGKLNSLSESFSVMSQQAIETEKTLFEQAQRTAEANFDLFATELANKYQQAEFECQSEYQSILSDLNKLAAQEMVRYGEDINNIQLEIQKHKDIFEQQLKITLAAIETNKLARAEIEKKNFYKLQISEEELQDVKKLRSIAPSLRNREPLDKVIWKTYYEKPTNALIGRVIGDSPKTGIYKITNLENDMCYIGQSVDLATRWKAHIKAGLGIDSTNNKLYTAMKQSGVENFMFEILEECNRTKLNEQEKFWINYFHSDSYGYNSTKGNG